MVKVTEVPISAFISIIPLLPEILGEVKDVEALIAQSLATVNLSVLLLVSLITKTPSAFSILKSGLLPVS